VCRRRGRSKGASTASPSGTPTEVAGGIAYANGIALAHDGSLLYVGESLTGILWAYPVKPDGTLGTRSRFAQTPRTEEMSVPDGITVDERGNVFVAHYGAGEILMYAPSGTLALRIPAGNRATAARIRIAMNAALAGKTWEDINGETRVLKEILAAG
jgi:sugar lactone lactonase YvrE